MLWQPRGAEVRSIEQNGLMLGMFPNCDYKKFTCSLDDSDRCLLYTDGVVEAPNAAGEEFGGERLQSFLALHASSSATAFCEQLMAQIISWYGRKNDNDLHDDVTIVVIDFKSSGVRRASGAES